MAQSETVEQLKASTKGFDGVTYDAGRRKFRARLGSWTIGYFPTLDEAVQVRARAKASEDEQATLNKLAVRRSKAIEPADPEPSNDVPVRHGLKAEMEAIAADPMQKLRKAVAALVETLAAQRASISLSSFHKLLIDDFPDATRIALRDVVCDADNQEFFRSWYTDTRADGSPLIVFGTPPWLLADGPARPPRKLDKDLLRELKAETTDALLAKQLTVGVRMVEQMSMIGDKMTLWDFRQLCAAEEPELFEACPTGFGRQMMDPINQEWFDTWRTRKRPEARGEDDPSPWIMFQRHAEAA